MKKIVITVLAVVAVLAIAVIFAFHRTDQPSEINENEIALQIQLDLKEDVGLLIIDSDIDGQKESGGISNADKTMLKKDDLIYWSIDKQHYETVSDTGLHHFLPVCIQPARRRSRRCGGDAGVVVCGRADLQYAGTRRRCQDGRPCCA